MTCLLISILLLLLLVPDVTAARGDVNINDVTDDDIDDDNDNADVILSSSDNDVRLLHEELKRLKKMFNRLRKGGSRGKKKLCEEASSQMSDKITMELSGLRSQLHTSDSVTSLRSELQYGLASLRAEVDNKVTSLRAEIETGLSDLRSQLQGVVTELKTEVTSEVSDVKSEMHYNLNARCGEEKDTAVAMAAMQAGLQTLRSDTDGKLAMSRADLEQRVLHVRSELESSVMKLGSDVKSDVVTARSDLQDMLSDVRKEMQDYVAGTRSELQTGFTAAQLGLQNTMHILQADLKTLDTQTEKDLTSVKAQMTAMKTEVEGSMAQTKSHIQGQLTTSTNNLEQLLDTLTNRVQQTISVQSHLVGNVSHIQQRLTEVKVNADKDYTTWRKDLDVELKKLKDHIEESNATFISAANEKNQTIQDLSKRFNNLDLKVADLQRDLEKSKTDLETKIKEEKMKMTAEASERGSQLVSLTTNLTLTQELLEQKLKDVRNATAQYRGSSYIRWGRTDCPGTAQIVYSGVVGGSSYDTDGGASNRLCLTLEPQPANLTGARTYIYGAEYKFSEHHDMDVVCAACFTLHTATIMIPGTHSCPVGWQVQYRGHLTAGMVGHRSSSEYLCLDSTPEHRAGSQDIRNGALFYYVFTQCGSLPCPPYTNMYVTCVVCSR